MQQHTKGILLLVLLEIYCSLQHWKNFANLSTIDNVIKKNKSGVRFFVWHGGQHHVGHRSTHRWVHISSFIIYL